MRLDRLHKVADKFRTESNLVEWLERKNGKLRSRIATLEKEAKEHLEQCKRLQAEFDEHKCYGDHQGLFHGIKVQKAEWAHILEGFDSTITRWFGTSGIE